MQLFYHPDITGLSYQLDRDESKHLIRVLRQQEGDKVYITDGKGLLYECHITIADPNKCILAIDKTTQPFNPHNNKRHIAIAPTKNIDRFEWFIEKATEIGVDTITPIITEHSERKVIKPERLERVLISALKQSNRLYLPTLAPLTSFNDFLDTLTSTENTFIAHCYDECKPMLQNVYKTQLPGIVIIGPEGDFSNDEIMSAKNKGIQAISLGSNRLRTETAAIVACTLMCIEAV